MHFSRPRPPHFVGGCPLLSKRNGHLFFLQTRRFQSTQKNSFEILAQNTAPSKVERATAARPFKFSVPKDVARLTFSQKVVALKVECPKFLEKRNRNRKKRAKCEKTRAEFETADYGKTSRHYVG